MGGAEKVVSNIIKNIDLSKFKLTVVSIHDEDINIFEGLNINYHCLQKKRLLHAIPNILSLIRKSNCSIIFSSLIHVNVFLCLAKFLKLYNAKLIIREANMPSSLIKRKSMSKIIFKYIYLAASKIICSSFKMRDEFTAIGLSSSKIQVLFNPVDDIKILNSKKLDKFNNGKLNIISVGRLTYQKGHDRLIKWLSKSQFKNIHLTIIGSGDLKKILIDQVHELNLHEMVSFEDYSNEIYSWIYSADVLIMYSRWEGMPNIILEALSLGTYAIASHRSGGVKDIIEMGAKNLDIFYDEEQLSAFVSQYISKKTSMIKKIIYQKSFF